MPNAFPPENYTMQGLLSSLQNLFQRIRWKVWFILQFIYCLYSFSASGWEVGFPLLKKDIANMVPERYIYCCSSFYGQMYHTMQWCAKILCDQLTCRLFTG
ncbi:hypothetical protein HHK36_017378 [Tetracentron sinense]|uniref:Uncharacterized protein n=1 Tax=Tetracentron sinense TaxID=13715 RepID=A0A834Z184_TETSI|nr:hypothetical protein HHK36_017378 [Tetracentron sinense]